MRIMHQENAKDNDSSDNPSDSLSFSSTSHQCHGHGGGGDGGGGGSRFNHGHQEDPIDWPSTSRGSRFRIMMASLIHFRGYRCESYFRDTRTMLAEQVWLASLHLDGVEAEWYYALEWEHNLVSWARFAEFLNLCFGPPIRSNSLGELKELYRTGSMEDYQRQFRALLCCCHYDDLSPRHQIDMFTAGLGQPLSSPVELLKPPNLQTTMSYAHAQERAKEVQLEVAMPAGHSGHGHTTLPLAAPTTAPAVAPS